MSTITDSWLASILMSPRPRPTAFDLATSQSQIEPVPYLLPQQEQPAHVRRLADALVRGQSQATMGQQLDDEALAAQLAFEASAKRTRQSVRPEGGRREGAFTEFVRDAGEFVTDVMVPQSPLDYALFALSAPGRAAVKAGLIGLGAALESSPAQAASGKLVQAGSNVVNRIMGRFPQFAEKYPSSGPAVRRIDPNTGKEYLSKELTAEAEEFARARARIAEDMERNGFERYFNPSQRSHVDSSYYPATVDTLAITPKQQSTINRYNSIIQSQVSRQALQAAAARGAQMPGAYNWSALGQLEQKFLEEYGPEVGRKEFRDFVTSIAATTAGADPKSNLLMAIYADYLRRHRLPYPTAAHELPHPIGGPFAMHNIRTHQRILDAGGWPSISADYPKRHDYGLSFFGHSDRGPVDRRVTGGIVPGKSSPPAGTYGLFEQLLHDEARRAGMTPARFTELVWAGLGHRPAKPMIEYINDAIERTHRLTGMSREEIVIRGLVRREIPIYGMGGLVALPTLQSRSQDESSPADGNSSNRL